MAVLDHENQFLSDQAVSEVRTPSSSKITKPNTLLSNISYIIS